MLDLLAINLACVLGTVAVTAGLRVRPLRLWPAAATLVSIILIQSWVLATGLTATLNLTAWRVIAAAVAAVSLVMLTRPVIRRELGIVWLRFRRTVAVIGPVKCGVIALPILTGFGVILTMGVLVGPYMPDLISYHLAPPTDWILAGRLVDRHWIDSRSWWPAGQGLLATWWMLPMRSLRGSILANVPALGLAVAVSWAWGRSLGLRVRWAALAALVPLLLPIVWAQGSSGLNDLPIAMLMLGAVVPLIGRRATGSGLMLSVAMMGVALGIKATPLPMLPPIGLLWLWRAWDYSRRREERGGARRGERVGERVAVASDGGVIESSLSSLRESPRPSRLREKSPAVAWAVVLGACVVLGGWWYGRNAVVWGNPLYPTTVNVGPVHWKGDPELVKYVGHFRWSNLAKNLPDLVEHRMWDDAKPVIRADVVKGTGFGPIAAGLGIVSLLAVMIGGRGRGRAAVAVLGASTLLMLASVEHDDWFGRFFMYAALVMGVCVVVAAQRMGRGWARRAWLTMFAVGGAAAMTAGVGSTVPLLVRTYWQEKGRVCQVPPLVPIAMTDQGWSAAVSGTLAARKPLVVFAPTHIAPVALLHGEGLTRPLIYADRLPDAKTIAAWKAAGATELLASVRTGELMGVHDALNHLGFRRVKEGVYAIP